MRNIIIFMIIGLFCSTYLRGQSLEDLKKVEELKKQLEQAGKTVEKPEEVTQAPSMTTFKDSLSQIPSRNEKYRGQQQTPVPYKVSLDSLPIFGHDIFRNTRIDYTPEIYGPVDEDYPVGPGDEVIITVWGEVELRHELTVDRDGQIYIPQVGLIKTNGNTISELTRRLKTEMGKSYSSLKKGRAFIDKKDNLGWRCKKAGHL
ncbi:MAG: polysaccharide biosynthesis/export family protein [Calditrichaceae bacterium]